MFVDMIEKEPQRMHEQEAPLIQLGPNSTYGIAYYGHISQKNNKKQARFIALVGGNSHDQRPKNYQAKPRTFLDRLLGIDRIQFTPAAAASNTWDFSQKVKAKIPRLESPIQMISMYLKNMSNLGASYATQLPLFTRNKNKQEQSYELDAQTTRSSRIDQREPKRTRVFPHNEGIIIETRREQSHRLRASRSTHSQRRASSRTKQGSLFINC